MKSDALIRRKIAESLTNVSSPSQQGNEDVYHTLRLHDLVQNVHRADQLKEGLTVGCHEDRYERRQHIICEVLQVCPSFISEVYSQMQSDELTM